MPIPLSCDCGASLQAADSSAGGEVACPKCHARLSVPPGPEAHVPVEVVDEEPAPAPQPHWLFPGKDPENADFFVPPPEEIGPLRSAHTSLLKTKRHKPFWLRLLIGVLLGLGVAAIPAGYLFVSTSLGFFDFLTVLILFALVICPVTLSLTLYFTRFRHYCGYVGQDGLAYFSCAGRRDRLKARDVFLFQDAQDLRVETTHHHVRGAYNKTTYVYTWSSESRKKVFVFRGEHTCRDRPTPAHDRHQFALAAEEAWSLYLLAQIIPHIHAGEAWTFRLKGNDCILFREDGLELHLGGKVANLSRADLAELQLEEGLIAIKEPGAREGWFTSTGVHRLFFADLANARVFLLLLERLHDVPIRSGSPGLFARLFGGGG